MHFTTQDLFDVSFAEFSSLIVVYALLESSLNFDYLQLMVPASKALRLSAWGKSFSSVESLRYIALGVMRGKH